ncbi:hypothetical protein Taro_037637 [Colocasia esculenta]|uniref:Uncharacterized protein n=1 Tax=Colocasia esculenta TaxID=4460 RepID=A0A843WGU5_COLES|nr:hypothetical protein [Colocasia esculenta]
MYGSTELNFSAVVCMPVTLSIEATARRMAEAGDGTGGASWLRSCTLLRDSVFARDQLRSGGVVWGGSMEFRASMDRQRGRSAHERQYREIVRPPLASTRCVNLTENTRY